MYRLYMYRNFESLREAFGAHQTYRTSMCMHSIASYTRRAVGVIDQYSRCFMTLTEKNRAYSQLPQRWC